MGPEDLETPDVNAQRAADGLSPQGPVVPAPVDAVTGGMPPADPTDSILAGLPAPPPPGPAALQVPGAPPVPGANADEVDKALGDFTPPEGADLSRTVPGAAPAVPGAPALPDGPQTKSAVPVAEDVARRQGELNGQIAADKAAEARQAHEEALLHQQDTQEALDHGNELVAARQKHFDDALDRYSGMKTYDYFSPDNPNKHSKLMAALSVAFGGLGAQGGENHALSQLKGRVDEDWKHQNDNIERARDSVVMARTGIEDAKEAKKALLEDNNARRVATLGSLETEARAQLAERGVPQAKIDTDARILEIQAARAAAAQKADEQRRKDALTEAQTKFLEARAGREARKGKGGGAGGGRANAIEAFTAAATDGTTPESKLAAMAVAAGYKPAGVQTAIAAARANRGMGAKVDAKMDADMQKELYTPKGPGTQLERIEAMRAELKDAIASGDKTAATRVLEEAGGMLSGGKSTKTTVELLHQLKSTSDELSSSWGRITGNPGDTKEFTQRLDKLLSGTAGEKRGEIESIQKRYADRAASKRPGAPASSPVETAKAALAGGVSANVKALLDSAREEVAKNGPHKVDAQRYIDAHADIKL